MCTTLELLDLSSLTDPELEQAQRLGIRGAHLESARRAMLRLIYGRGQGVPGTGPAQTASPTNITTPGGRRRLDMRSG